VRAGGTWANTPSVLDNKYGYNGKELNDDFGLGWNHHDWRFLDLAINRFVTIDPECESGEQRSLTPYHFSYNNPIRFSDPDGRFPIIPIIILVVGMLTTAEPANAPGSGENFQRDNQAFLQAKTQAGVSNVTSMIPIPASKAVAATTIVHAAKQKVVKSAAKNIAEKITKPNTLEPGPYAKESIPARSTDKKFTKAEREKINEIGKEQGCHTCGTTNPGTKSGNFIPDHQPASSLSPNGQRLYPHCIDCSRLQGGQANKAANNGIANQKLGN
jgi:RHS repeat-associated protein